MIRTLVSEVIEHNTNGRDPGDDGFTVVLGGKPRFLIFRGVSAGVWRLQPKPLPGEQASETSQLARLIGL